MNTTVANQIDALTTKIAELEKRLGRHSSNSSLSPSSFPVTVKSVDVISWKYLWCAAVPWLTTSLVVPHSA
ncbi:unnamed protein product [Acidithrix sp. C25]|nr:unnamed protein product [Acidithrix sp. C25]